MMTPNTLAVDQQRYGHQGAQSSLRQPLRERERTRLRSGS